MENSVLRPGRPGHQQWEEEDRNHSALELAMKLPPMMKGAASALVKIGRWSAAKGGTNAGRRAVERWSLELLDTSLLLGRHRSLSLFICT